MPKQGEYWRRFIVTEETAVYKQQSEDRSKSLRFRAALFEMEVTVSDVTSRRCSVFSERAAVKETLACLTSKGRKNKGANVNFAKKTTLVPSMSNRMLRQLEDSSSMAESSKGTETDRIYRCDQAMNLNKQPV